MVDSNENSAIKADFSLKNSETIKKALNQMPNHAKQSVENKIAECNRILNHLKSKKISDLANSYCNEPDFSLYDLTDSIFSQEKKIRYGKSLWMPTYICREAKNKRDTNRKIVAGSVFLTLVPAFILWLALGASVFLSWPMWIPIVLVGAVCFYHAKTNYCSLKIIDKLAIACADKGYTPTSILEAEDKALGQAAKMITQLGGEVASLSADPYKTPTTALWKTTEDAPSSARMNQDLIATARASSIMTKQ